MNRKRGYWIAAAFAAFLAFAGYNAAIRDWGDTGSNFVENLILGIVCTGLAVFFCLKKPNNKTSADVSPRFIRKDVRRDSSAPSIEERINEVGMLTELPVITSPHSIVLKPGEVCHYQSNAAVLLVKNEVVGHTRGHSGVSVRVAKGLTLHSGGSRGQAIRQDVAHRYPGLFTMTNQRIIMTGGKGFDQPVGKLTSITPYNGFQGITLQFGRSSYTILMAEPFWVPKIVELLQGSAEAAPIQTGQEAPEISAKDVVEIKFTRVDPDEGVETPDGAELSYLDARALEFWDRKRTDYEIPEYYEESAFGHNVKPALEKLLDGGYLEICGIEKRVALKTIPDLKAILADRELKTTGKKGELVQRILNNIPPDEVEELFPVGVYQITEKGSNALKPYSLLKIDRQYALGLSYYRLLQEKAEHPDEDDVSIIGRLLSEDIQKCYSEGDRGTYQRLLTKAAMFSNGNGDPKTALECYCLAFFVWTREIEDYDIQTGNTQSYYMAKEIEGCGKLCGMSLLDVSGFFKSVIRSNNPFALGTDRNINYAVTLFKDALSVK